MKILMVLFDASGVTSNYFRDKGYLVIQNDSKLCGDNLITFPYVPDLKLDGLICYPPCTYFSRARTRPGEFDLDYGLSTLDLCFRMKYLYNPKVFIIENPFHSRIRNYIGPPKQSINLGEYGFPTPKPTGLWGDFKNINPGTYDLPNVSKTVFQNMSTSNRSKTPIGLVDSIYHSNFVDNV
ncbi:MAG: DNA cytosine methyltransferase [Chitinophagales bacterium]|nr:DNA cytosine methyltransferase [Chitinophagales bacterium]